MEPNSPAHTYSLDGIAEITPGLSISRVPAETGSSRDGAPPAVDMVRFIQVGDIVEAVSFTRPSVMRMFFPITNPERPFDGRLPPLGNLGESLPKVSGIKWDKFTVRVGDVVLSAKGSVLKAALVGPETAGAIASSNILILRPNQKRVLPRVLLAVLRLPKIDGALRRSSRSSSMAIALNAKDVGKLEVRLPPMDQQVKLAETLEASERYLDASMRAIELKTNEVWSLVMQEFYDCEATR